VPETGLPKPVEVFHCEESFRFSPKRTWYACQFVERMKVDDALLQLKFQNNKVSFKLTFNLPLCLGCVDIDKCDRES
jgi:hypothetical protein